MAGYLEDLVQNIYTNCDMSGLDKLNQGLQDAIWYSGELEKNLRDAQRSQQKGFDFHARAINASKEAYKVESLRQKLDYEQQNFRARLAEQQQKWDETRQHRQDKYNKSLSNSLWVWHKLVRLASVYLGINTLKNIVQTGSRIQLIRASIEGLTKSTQDWDFIQKQAFRTGTEIEVVAKGYRNFFSSARMAGFGKEGIQGMYADVLLATRSIGATTQQTEGALLALEQMLSKGTVSMEELRRQLGNAIPGAFEIGAKAMKMTTKEFNQFVKTGKLASAEFVPKFIKELKDTYADGFKNIEQTVSVAQIRLSNSWKLIQADIMSGEAGKSFASALNILRETLDSPEFKQFIIYLGTIFKWAVKIFNFLIKNLRLVLVLLGTSGFYGLLSKNALMFRILNMEIGRSIGMLTLMGKQGKFAFAGLSATGKAFMATLFRILLPLMAIEDLVFFLGEKFLGWNTESAIGEALKSVKGNGNMSFTDQISDRIQKIANPNIDYASQYAKPGSKRYNEIKQALDNHDNKKLYELLHQPDRLTSGLPTFEKTEDNSVTIQMGDINIKAESSEPNMIAQAVQNVLLNLFTSQGLTTNVKGTVIETV